MRSDHVFDAMEKVSNRFLLAKVLAKATRKFHKPAARIEETINDVLVRCASDNPIANGNADRISTPVGSRRSRPYPAVVHRAGTFTDLPLDETPQAHSEPARSLVA